MTIATAAPGQLISLANAFVSQLSWENTTAVANTLEAAFYASLRGGMVQGGRVVNWMRETSIGYVDEIQTIFNLANIGLIARSTIGLLNKVDKGYDFSIKSLVALSTVVSATLFLGKKAVDWLAIPLAEPHTLTTQETVNHVQITHTSHIAEKFSLQQRIAKVLHVAKIALNLVQTCFVKAEFCSVVSLAMSSYSLWKNNQLKWITFTRPFPWNSNNPRVPVTELKPTYHMLGLPPNATLAKEKCAVCLNENLPEVVTFCANHAFCTSCIESAIHEKSRAFANVNNITKNSTHHYRNNVYQGTAHAYSITIDPEHLPVCSLCRTVPLQNTLSMEVTDAHHGKFNADVTIGEPPADRQYIFEKLYAVYNTAQAGLAFLQTYPELAGTIYKIQNFMLVTDLGGYALTVFYLFNRVSAKFNLQNSTTFKTVFIAALSLVGVASWYAMLQINLYLKPVIILNDVLKHIGLSADVLKILSVSFNGPMMHKMMQALLINRIVASAALMFFSQQRKTSLLNITTQLASLAGISALKWIEVVQRLNEPLQKIVASGGRLVGLLKVEHVKSSQVTHRFLVSSSCLTHLQSVMKSITDFTLNFFNKSSWKRYLMVTYRNGVEVSQKIEYAVTLQNNRVEACGCTVVPYLAETKMYVFDKFYGFAKVVTT